MGNIIILRRILCGFMLLRVVQHRVMLRGIVSHLLVNIRIIAFIDLKVELVLKFINLVSASFFHFIYFLKVFLNSSTFLLSHSKASSQDGALGSTSKLHVSFILDDFFPSMGNHCNFEEI